MEWDRVLIETNEAGVDVVTATLVDCGIIGVEIVNPFERVRFLKESTGVWDYADDELLSEGDGKVYVVFYTAKDDAGKQQLASVESALKSLLPTDNAFGSLLLSVDQVNDASWENEWKKHFKPLKIGRVTVVPEWESYNASLDEVVVLIDPGSAFGTGQHQSTQLAIHALSRHVSQGMSVLDIGCGSGVLSVTSILLGASFCFSCDIDAHNAISSTKRNAALNKIDSNRLTIQSGDALSDEELRQCITFHEYDIVVANIVADVVSELSPFAFHILKPGGVYITTGIIDEKKKLVEDKLIDAGFTDLRICELDGWVSIVGLANV